MIELLGLEGYTGHPVASQRMIEEQMLVWAAESAAQKEQAKRDEAEAKRRAQQG